MSTPEPDPLSAAIFELLQSPQAARLTERRPAQDGREPVEAIRAAAAELLRSRPPEPPDGSDIAA